MAETYYEEDREPGDRSLRPHYKFTRSWENSEPPTGFTTYESDEATVRSDMQCLFDTLMAVINLISDSVVSSKIPFDGTTPSGQPVDINAAIAGIYDAIEDIQAGTVTAGSITTEKLRDSAVTTSKLSSNAVTTEKLLNLAVTTAKLADLAVTTAKLAAGAVTWEKLSFSDSNGHIVLQSGAYGTSFPSSQTTGQIFFKKVV